MKKKTDWVGLDVIPGRRALEKRLDKGERIEVVIRGVLDPDKRSWSDDGTSTQFTLLDATYEIVEVQR